MFAQRKERNIPERNAWACFGYRDCKDNSRHHQQIDAMIGAPMALIRLHRNGRGFSETGFRRGAESGSVTDHEVRAETRVRTIESFMLQ